MSSINILYNGNYDHTFYEKFFSNIYDKVNMIKFDKDKSIPTDIDLVLFTGESNINPKYYNEPAPKKSNYNADRDALERVMFNAYKSTPKLGINRGALLLTAFCGGSIVQTLNGHNCGTHECEYSIDYLNKMLSKNNRSYNVKSNHTSMMFPYNLNEDRYSITLVSKYYLSDTYKSGYGDEKVISNIKYFYEPEIVNYFDYNTLCIQGDFDSEGTEYNQLCYSMIHKLIKTKK